MVCEIFGEMASRFAFFSLILQLAIYQAIEELECYTHNDKDTSDDAYEK